MESGFTDASSNNAPSGCIVCTNSENKEGGANMKIELKNREKSAYKKLCCTQSAKELKEDIVVPDT